MCNIGQNIILNTIFKKQNLKKNRGIVKKSFSSVLGGPLNIIFWFCLPWTHFAIHKDFCKINNVVKFLENKYGSGEKSIN